MSTFKRYTARFNGLLQGWGARDILAFANAVSALNCTRLGGRAGIPRLEEVQVFLTARGELGITDASGKERRS